MDKSTKCNAGLFPTFLAGPWPVVVLLACHFAIGLSAASRKSATFDENTFLTSGYSYWATNDYRMNQESGNWSQRWVALPIWLEGYHFPSLDDRMWQIGDHWFFADRFCYDSGNDADAMLLQGRAMTGVLSMALGLLVYLWSRRLFGYVGGLISLTLFVFSPTTLSLGFVATGELMVALFFIAAMGALWALVHRTTWFNLAASCLALAGLFLSKFSGVLIIPMGLLLVAVRLRNPNPLVWNIGRPREIRGRLPLLAVLFGVLLFQVFVVAFMIWASYGFRYSMIQPSPIPRDKAPITLDQYLQKAGNIDFTRSCVRFVQQHHLLPEGYLYGFARTIHLAQQREAFLNGDFSIHGWTLFFPYAMLVKTPLEVFVILILAIAGLWRRPLESSGEENAPLSVWSWQHGHGYSLAPLLVWLGVFWMFSLTSHLNIGLRHLLPTYPPMFILAGAAAVWFQAPASWKATSSTTTDEESGAAAISNASLKWLVPVQSLLAAALLLNVAEAIGSWPNYLAYFNFLAGGPANGYKHLVDSSLDWGQDLKGLKPWLDAHPGEHVYLSYFGTASPAYYGIDATILPGNLNRYLPHVPEPLTAGTYCISATLLQGVYQPTPGKWNVLFENAYQECRKRVLGFQLAANDPDALQKFAGGKSQQDIDALYTDYENLRLARLCSFLRARKPDFNVGHSILIYRLNEAEIQQATEGPPIELLPECDPDIKKYLGIP